MSIPGSASPLFLATAAAAAPAGHQIDRSLRFAEGDQAYLNRTPSSAGNRKTYTLSFWVKKSKIGDEMFIFAAKSGGGRDGFRFEPGDTFRVFFDSANDGDLVTTQVFRDPAAWYHFVIAVDTTQSTAANRVKIYVNGTQIEDFSTETYPVQNYTGEVNNTDLHRIGADTTNLSNTLEGYLTEIHFVDGMQLAPTDFGEEDSNGVWQPIDCKDDLTYGTNGFYLKFADNSSDAALGTDSSGNSNTFTVNNLQAAAGAASNALTAVSFDGVDDKLTLGTDSNLQLSGVFTLEAWIYRVGNNNEVGIFEGSAGGVGSCVVRVASNMLGLERHNTAFDILSSGHVPYDQWVHVAITRDSSNTCRAFINGTHDGTSTNNTHQYSGDFRVGQTNNGYWESAVSNLRLIKGTCLYTSNFTPPTTPLSNVTNTVLLICQDSSSATAATVKPSGTTIGTGGSPTAGSYPIVGAAEADSLLDTPTNYTADSGNNGGNYCTLNPLAEQKNNNITLSNGNLTATNSTGRGVSFGTLALTGKTYWEVTYSSGAYIFGMASASMFNTTAGISPTRYPGQNSNSWGIGTDGSIYNGSNIGSETSWTNGDVMGWSYDSSNGAIKIYKNGSLNGSYTASTSNTYFPAVSFSGSGAFDVNFGQRPFEYTPPTGHVSVCTENLSESAYASIPDGSTAFDITTFNNSAQTAGSFTTTITPDLIITKRRDATSNWTLQDIVRGYGDNKNLHPNLNVAETSTANITSVNDKTVSYGTNSNFFNTQVVWYWDAGTSTASNTDGNVTANVRANAAAGFSIISVPSIDSTNTIRTVGHQLNDAPYFIISKNRDFADHWFCYHKDVQTNNRQQLRLNTTDQTITSGSDIWAHTSSVMGFNGALYVASGNTDDLIFFCWTPIEGYSSFGSYTGNGDTGGDGTFVYTGMRPKFVLIKAASIDSQNWYILDAERDPYNLTTDKLEPNTNNGENASPNTVNTNSLDLLSNGFKLRTSNDGTNKASATYIYAAFAEHPFRSARAR